ETQPELYDRLVVLVVGDGVASTSTRQAAAEHGLGQFHVHPAIGKSAIRALLLKADACLLQVADASAHLKYGLSPNKLFDYFGAAKPVLISSASPTLVDDVRAGMRFAPGDPIALANAIEAMMKTPETERKAM